MGLDLTLLMQKFKQTMTQTPIVQIGSFVAAKICFGLIELPHESKESTYIPYLVANILFLGFAIGLKVMRHRYQMLIKFAIIQLECFLIWVISFIMMVFSWSLLDAIQWDFGEKIMVMICEFLSTIMLTMLTHDKFISKLEFISFEVILAIEIICVSIKTVSFIRYD